MGLLDFFQLLALMLPMRYNLHSLPNIKVLLLHKQQIDLGVVPPRQGVVKPTLLNFGGQEPPHPLRKFQVVLVLGFGQLLDLT